MAVRALALSIGFVAVLAHEPLVPRVMAGPAELILLAAQKQVLIRGMRLVALNAVLLEWRVNVLLFGFFELVIMATGTDLFHRPREEVLMPGRVWGVAFRALPLFSRQVVCLLVGLNPLAAMAGGAELGAFCFERGLAVLGLCVAALAVACFKRVVHDRREQALDVRRVRAVAASAVCLGHTHAAVRGGEVLVLHVMAVAAERWWLGAEEARVLRSVRGMAGSAVLLRDRVVLHLGLLEFSGDIFVAGEAKILLGLEEQLPMVTPMGLMTVCAAIEHRGMAMGLLESGTDLAVALEAVLTNVGFVYFFAMLLGVMAGTALLHLEGRVYRLLLQKGLELVMAFQAIGKVCLRCSGRGAEASKVSEDNPAEPQG